MLLLLLGAAAKAQAPPPSQRTLTLDAAHSQAQFTVSHFVVSHVTGRIPIKSATVVVGADGTPLSVKATLDPRGLDTQNGERDADLRSDHFFDVERFPAMTFTSTHVAKAGAEHFTVDGTLAMHGVEHPVTLDVHAEAGTDGLVTYHATGHVSRSDYGMTYAGAVVGNDVTIAVTAVTAPTQGK